MILSNCLKWQKSACPSKARRAFTGVLLLPLKHRHFSTAALSNRVTRKVLRPEARVAYLSEDKKSKAEEVAIEGLKTKLGTNTLAPMSQCPCTLHYTGKKISHYLSQRLMPNSRIQALLLPQPPKNLEDRCVPHTSSMVRILEKGE